MYDVGGGVLLLLLLDQASNHLDAATLEVLTGGQVGFVGLI
jgi:ATPase subunit of ABC transporter with duplicated ATPase domains